MKKKFYINLKKRKEDPPPFIKILLRVLNVTQFNHWNETFYHSWPSCRNLIGHFAVVDESAENAAHVNVSCDALLASGNFEVDIVVEKKSTVAWRGLHAYPQ